jgi:hypothetical protein
VTEDEAKTKWCPFARQMVSLEKGGIPMSGFSANRFNEDRVATCLGSACMAWRWHGYEATVFRLNARGEDAYHFPVIDPAPFLAKPAEFRVEPAHQGGYCGLSGALR